MFETADMTYFLWCGVLQKEQADLVRRMKSEQEQAAIEQEKKEQRRYEELVHYQQELEKQLEEKERKRQESYEEFLKEKLMVDEIVQKIYEEDRKWDDV